MVAPYHGEVTLNCSIGSQHDLLQVILPDNVSILNAYLPSSSSASSSIRDLIRSLLADSANKEQLASTFDGAFAAQGWRTEDAVGSSEAEGAAQVADVQREVWYRDAKGRPWAMQAVEVSEANREWTPEELKELGNGECPSRCAQWRLWTRRTVKYQGTGKRRGAAGHNFHALKCGDS